MKVLSSKNRAVGTGPAGPASAGPILQANENSSLNLNFTEQTYNCTILNSDRSLINIRNSFQ